jgi:hypothetical protein
VSYCFRIQKYLPPLQLPGSKKSIPVYTPKPMQNQPDYTIGQIPRMPCWPCYSCSISIDHTFQCVLTPSVATNCRKKSEIHGASSTETKKRLRGCRHVNRNAPGVTRYHDMEFLVYISDGRWVKSMEELKAIGIQYS